MPDGGTPFPGIPGANGSGKVAGRVIEGGNKTVFPVADELGPGGVIVGNSDETAGEAFGDDIAKGLGDAGEQKQIPRGKMAGEVVPPLGPAKDGSRVYLFQPGTLRSVPNHHHRKLPPGMGAQPAGSFEKQVEVLLPGHTADINQDWIALPGSPGSPEGGIPPGRVKPGGIDPPPEQPDIPIAGGLKLGNDIRRGCEGGPGAVMQPPEEAGGDSTDEAEAVVLHILLEVGVVAGNHRNLAHSGDGDG